MHVVRGTIYQLFLLHLSTVDKVWKTIPVSSLESMASVVLSGILAFATSLSKI